MLLCCASQVAKQLSQLHRVWSACAADNPRLQGELAALRRVLRVNVEVGMTQYYST